MTADPVTTRIRRPATDAERRALASVLRLRILRLCLYDSLTNKELADRLTRDPATVLHHVRTLLNQGFLRAEPPRPGPRGSTEVPYRATGKSWELDFSTPGGGPDLSGVEEGIGGSAVADGLGPDGSADVLLRTFLEEIAQVRQVDLLTTRVGLQMSQQHVEEFNTRVRALFDEFVTRGPDEGCRRWSVFLAVHPEP